VIACRIIDVSTLPPALQQQLGNPAARGVWFPPLHLRGTARSLVECGTRKPRFVVAPPG
jgi:hypothetical protein